MHRQFWAFKKLHLDQTIFLAVESIVAIDTMPGDQSAIVHTIDGSSYPVEGKASRHVRDLEEDVL